MSFPLTVGRHTLATPPELADLVRSDAANPGSVLADQRPAEWVRGLVDAGALEARTAVALAAALIQQADPVTIAEGARLARSLGERALGKLLVAALEGHDTGLLLQVDPAAPGRSVEDALLEASCELADLADPRIRGTLLLRLRNAALPGMELALLCEHGTLDELRSLLPAVFAEGIDDDQVPLLVRRVLRGGDAARVLLGAAAALPADQREQLTTSAERALREGAGA